MHSIVSMRTDCFASVWFVPRYMEHWFMLRLVPDGGRWRWRCPAGSGRHKVNPEFFSCSAHFIIVFHSWWIWKCNVKHVLVIQISTEQKIENGWTIWFFHIWNYKEQHSYFIREKSNVTVALIYCIDCSDPIVQTKLNFDKVKRLNEEIDRLSGEGRPVLHLEKWDISFYRHL